MKELEGKIHNYRDFHIPILVIGRITGQKNANKSIEDLNTH